MKVYRRRVSTPVPYEIRRKLYNKYSCMLLHEQLGMSKYSVLSSFERVDDRVAMLLDIELSEYLY